MNSITRTRRGKWIALIALWIAIPTLLPAASAPDADEIHWTITGPNSVTFDWRGTATEVRFGMHLPYDHTAKSSRPSPYPFSSAGPFHVAALNDLKPGSEYHYAIGASPDHTFRTPPLPGKTNFTIEAVGDIGSSAQYRGIIPVQDLIASRHPRFVLVLGDLTYGHPYGQVQVDRHFDDVMAWSQDAAYMPAWGNHEWSTPKEDDLRNYKGRFEFPHAQESPGAPDLGCCGKDWYWFDYGNVRFIAYPEPYSGKTLSDWYKKADELMQEADKDPKLSFIVTFGHQPPFSSGYHPSNLELRRIIGELGSRHPKFRLNLNGHSHDYERSSVFHGVTSVTVGTGGSELAELRTPCMFRECPAPDWSVFRAMHFGVLELHVGRHRIEARFLCGPAGGGKNDVSCKSGGVIDQFTIDAPKE